MIQPIWLLLEIVFKTAYSICNNPGISIIFVSLVVNILVLPLYMRADVLQTDERNKQKQMEPVIKHFRSTFKGDERFLVLSTFYRQNDYQPWYALKSSLSLLLQIPFFTAAYSFLSNLQLLQGESFLFIRDLGKPDSTFLIGGFPINLLPIAMTVINLVSSAIYTKGGPIREKVQTVALALIFLILLYNSPAGLVFYWTLNNLFSLGKNIVMKLLGITKSPDAEEEKTNETDSKRIWLVSSALLSVLVGLVIPMSVISSSPLEFIQSGDFADPTWYAVTTTAISAGFFLVWGGVAYYIGNRRFKSVYSTTCLILAIAALINFMVFSKNFGLLWDNLVFSDEYRYSLYDILLNTIFIFQLVFIIVVAVRKKQKVILPAMILLTMSLIAVGSYQAFTSSKSVRVSDKYKAAVSEEESTDNLIRLSRTGKNVVIVILDRAIDGYAPFIMDEVSGLDRKFEGFTYYPNTVSFGARTVQGAPALYGGYEYSAYEINKRKDEPLIDKINQALTLIPKVFAQEDYHSTVCDVPLGNLKGGGDMSIFNDIEDCSTHILSSGAYWDLLTEDEKKATSAQQQKRNFFCYSLTKVAPLVMQQLMYDDGRYNSLSNNRVSNTFANSYAVLKNLSKLTYVDDGKGELFIMHNYMTHEQTLLDPPDYVLTSAEGSSDLSGKSRTLAGRTMLIDNIDQLGHYDINASAYILLANWFDTLKEQGVYDNTRIILVADHGFDLGQFEDLIIDDVGLDAEYVNPLLMVKDYNCTGSFKTDNTFMTNADVPTIAMKDIISDPVNPYTGKPINSVPKEEGPLIITTARCWREEFNDETSYNPDEDRWFSVHDCIFDQGNWAVVDD